MNSEFISRHVIFSKDARESISKLENIIPRKRLNSILAAIHIFLQNSAHCGKQIHGNIYLYVTQKYSADTPALECYYTFEKGKVTIFDVSIAEIIDK